MGQWVMSLVLLGFTRLPLTWVAPAAAGTTTLNVCRASSGPGSYPDRALEVMWWCWSEAWDGCCSSHRVAPCASQHPRGLPWHTLDLVPQLRWQGLLTNSHPHDLNVLPAGSVDPCRESAST